MPRGESGHLTPPIGSRSVTHMETAINPFGVPPVRVGAPTRVAPPLSRAPVAPPAPRPRIRLGGHNLKGNRPWNAPGSKNPTELVSPEEIAKLLNQCSKLSGSGIRNRAILIVLWRGGLRVAEALALELRDVDVHRNTLHVRHGKGNKRRYVSIDPGAMAVIINWLKLRVRYPTLSNCPYLFSTRAGRPLSTAYARNLIKHLCAKAGLERRVHPHALRHAFAVELLYEGVPLNMIQAQLGHSNLAITSNYLAHVSAKDLNAIMQRRVVPGAVRTVL